jgi:hypothetical protein
MGKGGQDFVCRYFNILLPSRQYWFRRAKKSGAGQGREKISCRFTRYLPLRRVPLAFSPCYTKKRGRAGENTCAVRLKRAQEFSANAQYPEAIQSRNRKVALAAVGKRSKTNPF